MNKKTISFILGIALIMFSSSPAFCWMSALNDFTQEISTGALGASVTVSPDTFDEDYYISIDTYNAFSAALKTKVTAANAKETDFVLFEDTIIYIKVLDSTFSELSFGEWPIDIYLNYPDENPKDGILDGTSIPVGISGNSGLRVLILNEDTSEWVQNYKWPVIDTDNCTAMFEAENNSVYCLMAIPEPEIKVTDSSGTVITSVDFGDLEKGGVVTSTFKVVNAEYGGIYGSLSTNEGWIEITPSSFL